MQTFLFYCLILKAFGSSERSGFQSPNPRYTNAGLHWFHPPPAGTSSETPCQIELRRGRYETAIAAEFPSYPNGEIAMNPHGPQRNIFCVCSTDVRMACSIICTSPSMEALVRRRIGSSVSAEDLRPFFRADGGWLGQMVLPEFIHPDADPVITAALVIFNYMPVLSFHSSDNSFSFRNANRREPAVLDYGRLPRWDRPRLTRSESDPLSKSLSSVQRRNSAPAAFHFPEQYIPLRVCTDGKKESYCPITHSEFEAGQIVYILKSERGKALSDKSVGCISAEGMNKLKQDSAPTETFRDPLRRTGNRFLTIANDFEAFIISPDPDINTSSPSEKSQDPGPSDSTQYEDTDVRATIPMPDSTFYIKLIFLVFTFLIFFIFFTHYKFDHGDTSSVHLRSSLL